MTQPFFSVLVEIDTPLHEQLRAERFQSRRTNRQIISEALAEYFARRAERKPTKRRERATA